MNRYTDDTFKLIWSFDGDESYAVLYNDLTNTYHVHYIKDIEESSYTNYVVKHNYTSLTGNFHDCYNHFYVILKNNILHCDTGPAIFLPCGLDNFKPGKEIKHYMLHGRIMSQYSWLTWVKGTEAWPRAMASFLGSKNPE